VNETETPLLPERAANLAENPYAGQGPVMLDIGDDIGAIVLHLPASLEGAEVEIEPADDAGAHDHAHDDGHDHTHDHGHPHRPHVAVVGRPVGSGVAYSAVFPGLTEGRYALTIPGAAEPALVDVVGGQVTETAWPDASASPVSVPTDRHE